MHKKVTLTRPRVFPGSAGSPGVALPPGASLAWLRAHPPSLGWLDRPGWHAFRWRDEGGRWRTARRRVPDARRLVEELARHPPRDVYVGTASWLEPVGLPRLRDPGRPALLDHLVVFDIDRAPFSLASLERARRDAQRLVAWLARETALDLAHVAFSGAKGFHVVLRDPDRAPFALADPKAREAAVRASRAALLARVRAAGHEVDPTVTADTRRILRLPGTLHGATGWACAPVPPGAIERPVAEWIEEMPRHERALALPADAPAPSPRPATPRAAAAHAGGLELQASSHVAGTRERGAILAWTSARLPLAALDARLRAAGLGPALTWRQGERRLVLVPRALPVPALARAAKALRLGGFGAALAARGHAWVAVAPRSAPEGAMDAAIVPEASLAGAACAHPWSRPHLDLARRLGAAPEAHEGEACGSERASMRLAQIR